MMNVPFIPQSPSQQAATNNNSFVSTGSNNPHASAPASMFNFSEVSNENLVEEAEETKDRAVEQKSENNRSELSERVLAQIREQFKKKEA